MAEVFAASVSGETSRLAGRELALWKLRMLVQLQLIDLEPFVLPRPERPMGPSLRKAWEDVELLCAIRAVGDAVDEVVLARKFLARWLGVPPARAQRVKDELIAAGAIEKASAVPGPFGRPMTTWRPRRATADSERNEMSPAVTVTASGLAWRDPPRGGEEGLMADAEALVEAGIATWIEEEVRVDGDSSTNEARRPRA